MKNSVLFLVGPTGSGKTELALILAKRLGAEIISADSMLVYRGMNIGTAKPSLDQRRKIRHHLIDITSPRSNFSVYRYRREALRAIRDILKRGKIPLVVGGSGLYLEALWKGLSAPLGGETKVRKELQKTADSKGISYLYDQLKKIDPVRAKKIHPNDRRRIIRALEIAKISGKTPSEWYETRESLQDLGFSVRAFGVLRDRSELYQRINRRVEKMFHQGFLEEVKRLKKSGFSRNAAQALGYREILTNLKKETLSKPELIALIQTKTRQFAKRQLTWFGREKDIEWIEWVGGKESASKICDKIIKGIKHG